MIRISYKISCLFAAIMFLQLICYRGLSQNKLVFPVVNKFGTYSNKALQEKLFLHTDKDFYVAGEILWFKIYYTDGAIHKPLELSKIAYVEILNNSGKAEVQAKISLEPGQGKGSVYLPTTLNSGSYTIRSYTNWMKNFDAAYFFEKKITIVNTVKNSESLAPKDSIGFTIDYFPEGGNLVSDVTSKIGFKATDNKGKGIDFLGFVITETGDTVTRFRPFKFGLGNFLLKPQLNHTYKTVIVSTEGKTIINKPLPEIYNKGYVMNLTDKGDGNLRIVVYRKKLSGEQNTEEVLLVVHTRQLLQVAEEKIIDNNDSTVFLIAKSKIGQGVSHFTIFNGSGKPVCERLFFMKPASAVTVNVKSDQDIYTTRHKVNLSVNATYDLNKKIPLNLSASVFNLDILQGTDQSDIISYMWLMSDVKGDVESPGFYFANDPGAVIAIDNLMLTQGWRRFKWDEVLKEQSPLIKFLPEYNGQLISGKIINIRGNEPVNDLNAFLSVPGRPFGFYVAKSDPDGLMRFEVKNYYGNGTIIFRLADPNDSFHRIEIQSPFIDADSGRKYSSFVLDAEKKEQLQRRSINMQVQNIYSGDELKKFNNPVMADTLPFFGSPEFSYNLDDYKRFTSMEEVLREYVREINVAARNGKLSIKMFNPLLHDFYDGDVLVLLDGVPLSDADKILSYDPLKVKRLDVIQSQYIVGPSIFNGVASFSTYDGVFDKFEFDPRLVAIDYDGLQLQREFYSPVYETKQQLEKRIPDFRNTLLWSPDITTDQDGKTKIEFYTSDRPGKYMVLLQGMSANGDCVSTRTVFEVK